VLICRSSEAQHTADYQTNIISGVTSNPASAATLQVPPVVGWVDATFGQAAQRQVLGGHIPQVVKNRNLQSVSRLSSSQRLHLAIGLPLRNKEALDRLLQQIYDPASPQYRHYLTPQQFTEMFGPTEQDYQAVINFAKANGLTVTTTHPNRVVLDVEGSVADIEKALHVTMRVYNHPTEARTFYAPDVEPSVDLTVPILHISGLDNSALPRPLHVVRPIPDHQAMNATPNSGSGPGGTFVGNDFRAAYAPGVTLDGSGQMVGLLEFDGYYSNDIAAYESMAGLPSVTLTNVLLGGFSGSPTINTNAVVEVSLDIEMAISMAPGVSRIIVYEAPNPSPWADLLNRMANDNLAKQLSCSWGNSSPGPPDPTSEHIFQQMAAQGQSFFNASGDSDAFINGIPFPAESTNITQVGGTTLTTASSPGRWFHTATLLPSGQVLVAGGSDVMGGGPISGPAELYDPARGTWTLTGALNTAREFHTATLLTNGLVLVAGGFCACGGWGESSSAELYDPATGTWTNTGSMNTPRMDHTATLLTNGQVLVTGGDNGSGSVPSAELYDPATGTWANTGSMTAAREAHTATLLTNGLVLVAGAGSGAELYNPATGMWTATGSMASYGGRVWHTATLLTNGQVLVAGGVTGDPIKHRIPLSDAELYDPVSGTWTPTGAMNATRYNHTATLLTNGQVLVAGGYNGSTLSFSSAELYDPAAGTWTLTGSMITGRYGHTATLSTNGNVLVVAGFSLTSGFLSSAELYDPAGGTWRVTGAMTGVGVVGSWISETTWNWGYVASQGKYIGSGGGIGTYYAIPSWQQGIDMTANHGSTTMRNVPDVAMTADNIFIIADNGFTGNVGGTSCAAPLWAGFIALVNQQAITNGKPVVGFINPAISAVGKSTHYATDFHDITTGNNANSNSHNLFLACPGYDLCTGWGTPSGTNLINDLCGITVLVVNPSSLDFGAVAIGQINRLDFSVINTGYQPLSGVATPLVSGPFSVTGGSSYTVLAGKTQTVTVAFAPVASGTFTGSVIFTSNGGASTNDVRGIGVCTYALSSSSASSPAKGGTNTFNVNTTSPCPWIATTNNVWLTILSGGSGVNSGTVTYVVAPNGSSNARTGTVSVAGLTFTVTQAGNTAPQVSITPVSPITLPMLTANLSAAVTDEGAPSGTVSTAWSKVSGTGSVAFGNTNALNTTATFSTNGTYVLRLTASDGVLSTSTNVTVIVNAPPSITSPPSATNALAQVDTMTVAAENEPLCFTVGMFDPDFNPLSCQWDFGDSATSTDCDPCHVFTNCGQYAVSVAISDGLAWTNATGLVTIACPLTVTKMRVKVNFAKPYADSASLSAILNLDAGFSVTNKTPITLNIGGAQVPFTMDVKGRGVSPFGSCKLTRNKKTGLWTLTAKLAKGTWREPWATHGLVNQTVKPGAWVTMPVVVVIGDDALANERPMLYTATKDKSGSAK
jgi:subtilase family serine protease